MSLCAVIRLVTAAVLDRLARGSAPGVVGFEADTEFTRKQ